MKEAAKNTLNIIVKDLALFDDDMVLYVKKEWEFNSQAKVYLFEDEEAVPTEIKGYKYFLEIAIIHDVIETWNTWTKNAKTSLPDIVGAVLYYAENDAYKSINSDSPI